jgi:hypothetical protein
MPYDDPDPTDPLTLHGVAFETEDDEAMLDMVRCFIEEFARLGFTGDRILQVFKTKGYVGPHGAYRLLGEEAIRELVDEEMELRPRLVRGTVPETCRTHSGLSLPVIELSH